MCRLSWNLEASNSWNPHGLSRPVMGLLYLYLLLKHISDTGCQHDRVLFLSCHHDSARTSTSHVHIKSNGHKICNKKHDGIGQSTELLQWLFPQQDTSSLLAVLFSEAAQISYKQRRVFPHLSTSPSFLTWNITYIRKLQSFVKQRYFLPNIVRVVK